MDQHPHGEAQSSPTEALESMSALAAELSAVDDTPTAPELLDATSPSGASRTAHPGLDEREHALLVFERQWWKVPGSKERAIRATFGFGATRYYQLLNALIDRDEAVRHDPMLVKRLRKARSDRRRERTVRRLGITPES